MTDKRDPTKAPRSGRHFPPTAAEVPECPPHRWLIEGKWQQCRKCGARMEVPQPVPASARTQARREPQPGGGVPTPSGQLASVSVAGTAGTTGETGEIADAHVVEKPAVEAPGELGS